MTDWRAYAERVAHHPYHPVRLWVHDLDTRAAARPLTIELEEVEQEGVYTDPMLELPYELAQAIYDALGEALGGYSSDARQMAESLTIERKRVDQLLNTVQKVVLRCSCE